MWVKTGNSSGNQLNQLTAGQTTKSRTPGSWCGSRIITDQLWTETPKPAYSSRNVTQPRLRPNHLYLLLLIKNEELTDPINRVKTRTPDLSAFLSSASSASELEKCVMSDVTTGHVIIRLFHHSFLRSLFSWLNCLDLEDFNTKNKKEKRSQRLEFAGFRAILRNSVERWTNGFHEDTAWFQDTGVL